ncbi:MAG: glycoside hydrolase 3 protein [Piccolia ochrophora]|nr:MAG: glycoside hydrolase 3 protein [Piccolia ochrophora]
MRSVTLLGLALAAAPTMVMAGGSLGFAIGTKHNDGSCKYTADYEADFEVLKAHSTVVRGYDADDCNFAQQALPAAKSKGFQIILGIWPDTEESYSKGKNAVKTYGNQYKDQVRAVTVGSETLYRGNFTGDELVEMIKEVKALVPDTKVGTADSWHLYANGTADAVVKTADIVLVNGFAYWQGSEISNASHVFLDDIAQATSHIEKVLKDSNRSPDDLEIVVGETGWPTEGDAYKNTETGRVSEPGLDNAEQFWKEGICAGLLWGLDVFAFEAFDEPWKPNSVGDNGEALDETHWGVYTAEKPAKAKWDLSC